MKVQTAGSFSRSYVAMDICGRDTTGSPTIPMGFLDFQKVKLLGEKSLHWGLLYFPHLPLSNGRGQKKRWYVQWYLPLAQIPMEQGLAVPTSESCGRGKGWDVCEYVAQKNGSQ